ncbi:MAG: hypothetical protein QCI82_03425 [Candidatus Thermoplasmatota archaeon]|nr:hypothetical protein [Candidatus Thermoplasmatota archaeon]
MKAGTTMALAVSLAILILTGGMSFASGAPEAEAGTEFPELKVTEKRIENVLGGGDFIGIHNEDNDAMIGLLYGTEENPNHVYVISIFTRYLGVADIYDEDGDLLRSGKPIPVKTLYAQRFDTIYEFDDRDGDGIWDSRRSSGHQGNDSDINTIEPVFKKVPLRTGWTPSNTKKTDNGNGSVEWEVTLTAQDLGYKGPLMGLPVDRQNKLEKVELTFHLYAQRNNVAVDDVPVYRVEVSRSNGDWSMGDVSEEGNRTYSGSRVSADVKYDHYIEGWDFHSRNINRSLMLSTEILFLTAISPKATEHLRNQYWERFGEADGSASYITNAGYENLGPKNIKRITGDDPVLNQGIERPRIIQKNHLGIRDNWDRIGGLTWVSNVTVDGNETDMHFQVYFARAFAGINANGALYAGFGVVGGFSYPGGSSIYHDPGYEVGVLSLDEQDQDRPFVRVMVLGIVFFIAVALVVVVAVVSIGGLMAMRRRESIGKKDAHDADFYETYYIDKDR